MPIRLCALRVEFAPDSLSGTTGDGSFGSGFPDTLKIDPLPHDRSYFEDHLAFLVNYYETASRGRLEFETADLYPSGENAAYRVAFPMWHYNYNSDTALLNDRLIELFAESVSLAAEDVNFLDYDAILVFHAGVGKDFNIGFDNTPFDIPSAYISSNDLATYGGSLPPGVTRGLILPESQNQVETLEFGIELSINGVIVKLFGNWLGMPDLYNTETGASGVGRWGMMDQGSGNVNAIVPSLPDAWSRIYMGWEQPFVVYPSGVGDTVRIGRYTNDDAHRIVKIPVSATEYYLLENRDADADSILHVTLHDRDDRVMQIDRDGNLTIEPGFAVATQASHYDFGIPGSGLLIWHIDEAVITETVQDNRVNTNPARRGVDLVEADGSQDIGREYGFATAGSGTELGIQEDCWYRDNRAFRDANGGSVFVRFNDNTRPSARLNDHSYTFLEISDFSDVAGVMSCRIRGTLVEDGFPVAFADEAALWTIADLDGDSLREFYVQAHDSLFKVDSLGSSFLSLLPLGVKLQRSAVASIEPTSELMFIGEQFGVLRNPDSDSSLTFATLPPEAGEARQAFYCQTASGAARYVVDFARGAGVYTSDLELLGTDEAIEDTIVLLRYLGLPPSQKLVGLSNSRLHALSVGDDLTSDWSVAVSSDWEPVVVIEPDRAVIYDEAIGYLDAFDGTLLALAADCLPPDIDWDGDGRMEGGGANGADYTPREDFALPAEGEYSFHDLNFDGQPDVLETVSAESVGVDLVPRQLVAYDHETRRYADFPMAINGQAELVRLNPEAHRYHVLTKSISDGRSLFTLSRLPISPDGTSEEVYQVGGISDRLVVIGPSRPQVHNRSDFVYCWPNPTADVSRIRLTLPYATQAHVKIFDIAGRAVAELEGSSTSSGAFEIPWSTSGLQSGVYVARIEAESGGKVHSAEIKIAVVR